MNPKSIILGQVENIKAASNVWSFKKVDDIVNGIKLRLTNMASGYPFEFAGRIWPDSERLYLAGEWSNGTEEHKAIQEQLLTYKSGYAAKRFGKSKFKGSIRKDFADFRLQWMLFCVWQKTKGNADFRKLLFSIPNDVTLVENTTSDHWESAQIWGCQNKVLTDSRKTLEVTLRKQHSDMKKKDLEHLINVETNKFNNIGTWTGQNNIAKILMICRQCVISCTEPAINYQLLSDGNIYLFGQKLDFMR